MFDKNLFFVEFVNILLLVLLQIFLELFNIIWYKIFLVEGILVYSYLKNFIFIEKKLFGNKSVIKINFYELNG